MRLVTFLKFGVFSFLLICTPLLTAVGFFYLHEAHTSTYLGFFVGLILDALFLIFLIEPLFRTTINMLTKKRKRENF